MSKVEILAELPRLSADERAEIQAKLEELAGDEWLDGGDLTDQEKTILEARLAECEKHPDAGSSWEEAEARIGSKLHR